LRCYSRSCYHWSYIPHTVRLHRIPVNAYFFWKYYLNTLRVLLEYNGLLCTVLSLDLNIRVYFFGVW